MTDLVGTWRIGPDLDPAGTRALSGEPDGLSDQMGLGFIERPEEEHDRLDEHPVGSTGTDERG